MGLGVIFAAMAEEKLAKMKEQVYMDPRPKEYFDRFHARARTAKPNWVYELVRIATSLYAYVFLRARSIGTDKVPQSGPVILAPNHFSFMDHFFSGAFIRRSCSSWPSRSCSRRRMQYIYYPGGVFPVRRGAQRRGGVHHRRDDPRPRRASCMYCEGGRSRTGELSEKPKRGIGRLALESGATIVPVAIHGSSKVRNWKRLQFPKVIVQYGEPDPLRAVEGPTRDQQQAVADEIFAEITALYARLDAEGADVVAQTVRAQRRARRASGAAAV